MTTPTTRPQVELIGRELFGKAGRLTLGMYCALNIGKAVTWAEYRVFCRTNDWPALTAFRPDIERFEKLGMVTRVPNPSHRQHWWTVEQSDLWGTFTAPLISMRLQQIGVTPPHAPKPDLSKVREDLLDVERRLRGDA